MKYSNILIKFSGESFGKKGLAVDKKQVAAIAREINDLRQLGIKIAVVCGGGNVSRWKDVKAGDRVEVDLAGMKGTLKNVRPLADALKKIKVPVQVYTSFSLTSNFSKFNYKKVKKDWQAGKVLIFAGGTGHPFFTTDTAAILRGLELGVEVFIKATKVDGIYTADPVKSPKAKKISIISYQKYLEKNLRIIDPTAISLAWENSLSIEVVKWQQGAIIGLLKNKVKGSVIK